MYTRFFNLDHAPFSIAPDPRYLYMSDRHREALAHLLYGVSGGGGFVLLTGEIGAGKTTVCRCFLEQIPENCNVAYIFNPKLTVSELLQSICEEFHIPVTQKAGEIPALKTYIDRLTEFLLASHAKHQNNVLIIDEAQNLSPDVLEQLRLLTNLETSERKLLQIILIGQPELRTMLERPDLEQLAQRVIARYHLAPLSAAETAYYIHHRLSVAGKTSVPPFPSGLMKKIHAMTGGVPRRINLLCDRALLGAYAEGKTQVTENILRKAAREVFGQGKAVSKRLLGLRHLASAGAAIAMLAGAAWIFNAADPAQPPQRAAGKAGGAITQAAPALSTAVAAPTDPRGIFDSSERDEAVRKLALLWGETLPPGDACKSVRERNLHCYTAAAIDLDELRRLDRPAIVAIYNDADDRRYAIIRALGKRTASLEFDGKRMEMKLAEFSRRARDGFVTLWRAPSNYRDYLAAGEIGEEVDWVALQLARYYGEKDPAGPRQLDSELIRRVQRFQLENGIKADGVVGPRTYMQLNRVAGIGEPALTGLPAAKPRKG
ncbi:MAG: putative peptidoglycan binding domain protein [Paucimonas sp.]|jgi:general secretion pathway protein A|nr:putative peptidoglycan binding domain protein [Paucimonas sp.]